MCEGNYEYSVDIPYGTTNLYAKYNVNGIDNNVRLYEEQSKKSFTERNSELAIPISTSTNKVSFYLRDNIIKSSTPLSHRYIINLNPIKVSLDGLIINGESIEDTILQP